MENPAPHYIDNDIDDDDDLVALHVKRSKSNAQIAEPPAISTTEKANDASTPLASKATEKDNDEITMQHAAAAAIPYEKGK